MQVFISLLSLVMLCVGVRVINGFTSLKPTRFTVTRTANNLQNMAMKGPGDYSMPDQQARFAKAKADNNPRVLDIDSVYSPAYLKGKNVLVTGQLSSVSVTQYFSHSGISLIGGNRGIGLAIATEAIAQGANVYITSRKEADIPGVKGVITGIDVTDNSCGDELAAALNGEKIDFLVNNAGYFYGPVETLETLNFEEEMKMIDICAMGPLRITSGLANKGLLASGSKVLIVTIYTIYLCLQKFQLVLS